MIPIKYIGHRPVYRDGACGSELVFEQGKTLLVEDEFAVKMLRHPSVYERGDAGESVEVQKPKAKATKDTGDEDPAQAMRDSIVQMNKAALETFAKTHFSVDLDKRKSVGDLRTQVTGLFDQFGIE
jgi:hypothetical protein